jgi:hypothetical protein
VIDLALENMLSGCFLSPIFLVDGHMPGPAVWLFFVHHSDFPLFVTTEILISAEPFAISLDWRIRDR